MIRLICFIFAFAFLYMQINATEISGVCFEDLNQNKLLDPNEKGFRIINID